MSGIDKSLLAGSLNDIKLGGEFRGKYTGKLSAFALVKQLTGDSTVTDAIAYCAAKHNIAGWSSPLFVRRGALVAVRNDDGEIIAGLVSDNGREVLGDPSCIRAMAVQRGSLRHCAAEKFQAGIAPLSGGTYTVQIAAQRLNGALSTWVSATISF